MASVATPFISKNSTAKDYANAGVKKAPITSTNSTGGSNSPSTSGVIVERTNSPITDLKSGLQLSSGQGVVNVDGGKQNGGTSTPIQVQGDSFTSLSSGIQKAQVVQAQQQQNRIAQQQIENKFQTENPYYVQVQGAQINQGGYELKDSGKLFMSQGFAEKYKQAQQEKQKEKQETTSETNTKTSSRLFNYGKELRDKYTGNGTMSYTKGNPAQEVTISLFSGELFADVAGVAAYVLEYPRYLLDYDVKNAKPMDILNDPLAKPVIALAVLGGSTVQSFVTNPIETSKYIGAQLPYVAVLDTMIVSPLIDRVTAKGLNGNWEPQPIGSVVTGVPTEVPTVERLTARQFAERNNIKVNDLNAKDFKKEYESISGNKKIDTEGVGGYFNTKTQEITLNTEQLKLKKLVDMPDSYGGKTNVLFDENKVLTHEILHKVYPTYTEAEIEGVGGFYSKGFTQYGLDTEIFPSMSPTALRVRTVITKIPKGAEIKQVGILRNGQVESVSLIPVEQQVKYYVKPPNVKDFFTLNTKQFQVSYEDSTGVYQSARTSKETFMVIPQETNKLKILSNTNPIPQIETAQSLGGELALPAITKVTTHPKIFYGVDSATIYGAGKTANEGLLIADEFRSSTIKEAFSIVQKKTTTTKNFVGMNMLVPFTETSITEELIGGAVKNAVPIKSVVLSNIPKPIFIPPTQKLETIPLTQQNFLQINKVETTPLIKPAQIPNIRSRQEQQPKQETKQQPALKQELKQQQELKQELKLDLKLDLKIKTPEKATTRIIPFATTKTKFSPLLRREKGYILVFRELGKEVKFNKPLPKAEALRLGRDVVENSISASFKVLQTNINVPSARRLNYQRGTEVSPFNFTRGTTRKTKEFFVEKTKFRINTKGEKQGLSVAKALKSFAI